MVKMNESYTTLFGPADIPNIQTDADEDEMEGIDEGRRTGSEKIKQECKRIMKKKIKRLDTFFHMLSQMVEGMGHKKLS